MPSQVSPVVLFGFAVYRTSGGPVEVWAADDAGMTAQCVTFTGRLAWARAIGWVLQHRRQSGC